MVKPTHFYKNIPGKPEGIDQEDWDNFVNVSLADYNQHVPDVYPLYPKKGILSLPMLTHKKIVINEHPLHEAREITKVRRGLFYGNR